MAGQARFLVAPPPPVPVPRLRECPPPSLAELETRGRLSKKPTVGLVQADVWKCRNSAAHPSGKPVKNRPINALLLNLPPLYCSGCGELNPFAHRWKVTECTLNRVLLDFGVRSQGNFDTCVPHAILVALDMQRVVDAALLQKIYVKQPLNIDDLFQRFLAVFGVAFSEEEDDPSTERLAYHSEECLFYILQEYGVRYITPTTSTIIPRAVPRHHRALRVLNVFRVPHNHHEHIVMLIANGFALVAGIPAAGRAFKFTAGGEIYDAGESEGNHCVLLIGSGVCDYPSNPNPENAYTTASWPPNPSPRGWGPRLYFPARNSWDTEAHPESSRIGHGADFNIWADQLDNVPLWGFHLPPPRG